jgi:hypothetical protein
MERWVPRYIHNTPRYLTSTGHLFEFLLELFVSAS